MLVLLNLAASIEFQKQSRLSVLIRDFAWSLIKMVELYEPGLMLSAFCGSQRDLRYFDDSAALLCAPSKLAMQSIKNHNGQRKAMLHVMMRYV